MIYSYKGAVKALSDNGITWNNPIDLLRLINQYRNDSVILPALYRVYKKVQFGL
jgi:hypothetical protein